MRSVAKIRALPAADRWLLVKALVAVIAVRLRLKLRPFRPATEDAGRLNRTQETGLSPERIAAQGGNKSMIHIDWMIGSDKLDIDGVDAKGARTPVFRKGEWA